MRRAAIILIILIPAISARARVDIKCTADDYWVTVSYALVGEPNKVRAFALDITVDNGAKIIEVNNVSPKYWVYPGSIQIDPAAEPPITDYGSPVADPNYPGTLGGLGTNGITIEMGALYDPPGDNSPNAPHMSGTLLKFRVDKWFNCVTIKENAIRGGIVLTNPALNPDVNAPNICTCSGCFPCNYSTYNDWVRLGRPNCWCGIYGKPPWPYQCDGNADNISQLVYVIYVDDLTIMANNWKKKIGDPTLDPCADFDHKGQVVGYRVYTNDLTILTKNWKKKGSQLPGNCPRPE